MQSMQRQFGKLMNRGPGENAKVSVLLHDYEDADRVLAKIIDETKSLRDAWTSLAATQFGTVKEFEQLYDPIVGAMDGHGRLAAPTPDEQLRRTFALRQAYEQLRTELAEDALAFDAAIIQPATVARDYIQPVRRTIKKRENKRLDYEKCQDKVAKLQRKGGRSVKEDGQLGKLEDEMSRLSEEFSIADAHLRETLPPIITAAFSLIPPLIASHVHIQNRLLGVYYTVLHGYCEEQGFPSPPPPMDEVKAAWAAAFRPAQREVESIPCVAHGKAVRLPMSAALDAYAGQQDQSQNQNQRKASTGSMLSLSRTSTNGDGAQPPGRPMRIPSVNALSVPGGTSPAGSDYGYSPQPSPRSSSTNVSGMLRPTDFTTATALGGNSPVSPQVRSVSGGGGDYFGAQRDAGQAGSAPRSPGLGPVVKKRPPPPPPKRPSNAGKNEDYVVAQYDFAGQGGGDLSFSQGDRIRVVKRTATDQDWWVGELAGRRGNFPANYTKAA